MASDSSMVTILLGGEELDVPRSLLEDHEVFTSVLSMDTWTNVLDEEDRERLRLLLPNLGTRSLAAGGPQADVGVDAGSGPQANVRVDTGSGPQADVGVDTGSGQQASVALDTGSGVQADEDDILKALFSGDNVMFGNPLEHLWKKLNGGCLCPQAAASCTHLIQLKYRQYELNQQTRYLRLLQEILLSRQLLLQNALFSGGLENLTPAKEAQLVGGNHDDVIGRRTRIKYKRLLQEVKEGCGQNIDYLSSDEDSSTNQNRELQSVTEHEYWKMLRKHRKRRKLHRMANMDTVVSGLTEKQVIANDSTGLLLSRVKQEDTHVIPKRKRDQEVNTTSKRVCGTKVTRAIKNTISKTVGSQTVYEVYKPLQSPNLNSDPYMETISLQSPLPVGRFMNFFSLIKYVFVNLLGGKGELSKLVKNVKHSLKSPEVSSCLWAKSRDDWSQLTLSAICYLAAEVGAVSSFLPLSHFIPLVEFRDRIDHWKWIGNGRDSDVELLIICNHWLENLQKSLLVVDYSEYEPPAPHIWTAFTFRPSNVKEIIKFRQLEVERYRSPQKAFIYAVHGFEAPVGPVKGSRSTKKEASSKARGHALLIPLRPTCVTILSLVRDATSRLPNGEGTRIDLCTLVQDSQYLSENVSDTQLNNAVSGALDRLHYEKDPCVRYDGSRKVWIYLHRGRSEEDFEQIFWACEVASNQRKRLMSRPKMKPRVVMEGATGEIVLDLGGSDSGVTGETATKPLTKKAIKNDSLPTKTGTSLSSTPSTVMAGGAQGASLTHSLVPSTSDVPVKLTSTRKPLRKRKPTQKSQEAEFLKSKKHNIPPKTSPSSTFQPSDWESSDEEVVLPFLDSSLTSIEDKLDCDSDGSSWVSSDSDKGDSDSKSVPDFNTITPNAPPNRLMSASSAINNTPSFLTEPPNYLPETPTVTTPTFMNDISMEDDSDVLSQQLMKGDPGKWLNSSSDSEDSY